VARKRRKAADDAATTGEDEDGFLKMLRNMVDGALCRTDKVKIFKLRALLCGCQTVQSFVTIDRNNRNSRFSLVGKSVRHFYPIRSL
jgi:hypothetical protein